MGKFLSWKIYVLNLHSLSNFFSKANKTCRLYFKRETKKDITTQDISNIWNFDTQELYKVVTSNKYWSEYLKTVENSELTELSKEISWLEVEPQTSSHYHKISG